MHRVIICYMHNRKYRLRYGQSVTCLFHSVKFFALAVQSTLLVTLREIYRNEGTQIHNHTTRIKQISTKQTQMVLETKQKALRCKGVDVLEGERWKVNSREEIKDYR